MSRHDEARDRAAQWIIAQEEPDWNDERRRQLDHWLATPGNRVAYLRLSQGWSQLDRIKALGQQSTALPPREPWLSRLSARGFAMAASVALVAGLGSTLLIEQVPTANEGPVRLATSVGGHRKVRLSDGTQVELNTASQVRTGIGKARREAWLDQGEAYFDVAHDPAHPFVVHAGDRDIVVLGTQFSVRRDRDRIIVAVAHGRVRIERPGDAGTASSAIVTDGRTAVAQGAATMVTTRPIEQTTDAFAWREGMLRFERSSLADVAAEFNRYNRLRLVVTPGVSDIRIGGAFPATQPEVFARLLQESYGLKMSRNVNEIILSN